MNMRTALFVETLASKIKYSETFRRDLTKLLDPELTDIQKADISIPLIQAMKRHLQTMDDSEIIAYFTGIIINDHNLQDDIRELLKVVK